MKKITQNSDDDAQFVDIPLCSHVYQTIATIELDPDLYKYEPTCNGYDSERKYYGRIAYKQKCLNCKKQRVVEDIDVHGDGKLEMLIFPVIAVFVTFLVALWKLF